jgi:phosphoglucosamine mutase
MQKFPQIMQNVKLARKFDLDNAPAVRDAVALAEEKLAGRGRVLLRPSGTEPVVRVMVEGEDGTQVQALCSELVLVVTRAVG